MPNVAKYLNQTVTVRRITGGYDFEGQPAYGDPEELPARKTVTQKQARSAQGAEILASTEVWLLDEILIGDTVDGEPVQDRENVVAKDGTVLFWRAYL